MKTSEILIEAAESLDEYGYGYVPFHIKHSYTKVYTEAEMAYRRKADSFFLDWMPEYLTEYIGNYPEFYKGVVIALLLVAAIAESEGD